MFPFQAVAMEQFAQKRGYASLRYDQSSTGQTTGVKREEVSLVANVEDSQSEPWSLDVSSIPGFT